MRALEKIPLDYAARNLGRSPRRTALCVCACALVALLIVVSVSFVRGMNRSLLLSGSPDNVILLGAGSEESVERSTVDVSSAGAAAASIPGIRRRLGVDYVSPELHMMFPIGTDPEDEQHLGVVRGVSPTAFLVHPQVRIHEGRLPRAGKDEVLVGSMVASALSLDEDTLAVGQSIWFDGRPWRISGRFRAPGTVMNGEIWAPLADLQIVGKRQDVSCVILTMDPSAGGRVADVEAFAVRRLDLELVAMPEVQYYGRLVDFFAPIRYLVFITAVLCALGGILGGLNALYAAFSERQRELATLEVLGFSRAAIALALLFESILLTSTGAVLAGATAKVFLDGIAVRFSIGSFGLLVDGVSIASGITVSLVLGLAATAIFLLRFHSNSTTEALRS